MLKPTPPPAAKKPESHDILPDELLQAAIAVLLVARDLSTEADTVQPEPLR